MKTFVVAFALLVSVFVVAGAAQSGYPSDDGGIYVIVLGFLYLFLAICLYLLPTIVGTRRGISTTFSLFFVNLFFGWTVIGWFGCMIWAAAAATKAQDAYYRRAVSN